MSAYGSDPTPDKKDSYELTTTDALIRAPKVFAEQWTYDGYAVQHLGKRIGNTNVLIKYEIP